MKILLFIGMLLSVDSVLSASDFNVSLVNKSSSSKINMVKQLQQFESEFIYPFSEAEEFRIKHGVNGNYFSFFETLGKPYYYVAIAKKNKKIFKNINGKKVLISQKKGEIAAAICCVLEDVKTYKGEDLRAWYICDLKVNQRYQGEHLPTLMAKKISFWRYLQCQRGFAICMNPVVGEPKAASIFKKHGSYKGMDEKKLNLYTLSAEQVEQQSACIKEALVKHGYMKVNQQLDFVSTHGLKDYEIRNKETHATHSWNLFHIRPGRPKEVRSLSSEATYMICAIEGTALDDDFKKYLGFPSSTAQLISYGMKDVDFNYLASNQI